MSPRSAAGGPTVDVDARTRHPVRAHVMRGGTGIVGAGYQHVETVDAATPRGGVYAWDVHEPARRRAASDHSCAHLVHEHRSRFSVSASVYAGPRKLERFGQTEVLLLDLSSCLCILAGVPY